ncbi:MAG: carboxypeptidase S [Lentinula lateritia]|uniref:Carboxypeptidase S n=1 Tax=Lentinula lateritia TaxID=40482 RepID=A0ABQ8VV33_9AGAR|nr:MAG: carboxypeptidase S [Lentinula lateritia]KAJ4500243.1 carboxypeptidase S [Lentinula lateritia]
MARISANRTFSEKGSLLPTNLSVSAWPARRRSMAAQLLKLIAVACAGLLFTITLLFITVKVDSDNTLKSQDLIDISSLCPQAEVRVPHINHELWSAVGEVISTNDFKVIAIDWLSGAVQIETETYDDLGPVGEDPRWENRLLFHEYLENTFPLVHSALKLERINTYGLLYTWQGSNVSLKPSLLMAHFDVVPVNSDTLSEWAYPPYSGHFDGKLIWGRGSNDDKSGLISTIGAIEVLLRHGFQPTRTFVVAFGFDEEGGGLHGAKELADAVLNRYGQNSFAFIIDEGGGFSEQFGTVIATPGIAEKGSMNANIHLAAPGGHSSTPPEHTSIGILSALLVQLENHPFEVHIERGTPSYELLQCFAEHGATIPSTLRDAIKDSANSDDALQQVENILFKDPWFKTLIGTTQAVDVIRGGIKSNALPEQAWAIVNHRIATTSSVNATTKHDIDLFLPLATKFGLQFSVFGEILYVPDAEMKGNLKFTTSIGLEPAPVTPIDSAPYQLLSGTIKATYNAHRALQGNNIAVGPGMPTGNTDTKYYWSLSDHIFRYKHHNGGSSNNPLSGAHTVNESFSVDSLLETIRFFVTLILNADESNEF